MQRSPLAPDSFPSLPSINGVTLRVSKTGIKYQDRYDMLLATFNDKTAIAGVFTQSNTASSNILWGREAIKEQTSKVLVVNAGNANASNGKYGVQTIQTITDQCARLFNCSAKHVIPCATGVIGERMPDEIIQSHLDQLVQSNKTACWEQAAQAITTTDTFTKGACSETTIDGKAISIVGIAKGSGMIAPNMATMLAYIFTDAAIDAAPLQALLNKLVEKSFNAITVDSDTSTSDSLLIYATGEAGNKLITDTDDPALAEFEKALEHVMIDLAHQIVKDGEGASKFIEVSISGAQSNESAKTIALSIANSPLVKTAIAGEDANWGRIIMAIGKSNEPINTSKLSISIGNISIAIDGQLDPLYNESDVAKHMQGTDIIIHANVGTSSDGSATVWTCDLTHEYISINADYRS